MIINMDLAMKLRSSTKTKKSRKNKRILGTSIEERSESIDTREGIWTLGNRYSAIYGKKLAIVFGRYALDILFNKVFNIFIALTRV